MMNMVARDMLKTKKVFLECGVNQVESLLQRRDFFRIADLGQVS